MTEIKLHTLGEKLIVSEKVTLASGNINSAELHVTLDEAWAAYPNISATFETKEYIEPVDVLMLAKTATEYVCVIPAEVLQEQGTLEIAIRGVSNDGETAKTSSYARYNIVRGASPGDITLKPTMDLYQQYLAAMNDKTAPLFEAYKKDIQAEHEKNMLMMSEEYETFKAACIDLMKPIPLWTNPEPFNFGIFEGTGYEDVAVKFNADLSGYQHYIVVFYYRIVESSTVGVDYEFALVYGHNGQICSMCSEKGVEQRIMVDCNEDNYAATKYFTIEDDGITVASACGYNGSRMVKYLMPYQVIGFCPDVE